MHERLPCHVTYKFCEMTDCILEMVQDRNIVTMEDQ